MKQSFPNKAIVLAAGFGKRLAPLTDTCPKPLLPLKGKPILAYIFDHIQATSIQTCLLNTHHLAKQIQAYAAHRSSRIPKIVTLYEPEILDTGGGVKNALDCFPPQPIWVINGDIWWEDSPDQASLFQTLLDNWDPDRMDTLMALIPKHRALGYSGKGDYHQETSDTGPIGPIFYEQPAPYVYGGVHIVHPRLFDSKFYTIPDTPFSLKVLWDQAEKTRKLYGVVIPCTWADLGTSESLRAVKEYTINP